MFLIMYKQPVRGCGLHGEINDQTSFWFLFHHQWFTYKTT